MNLKKTNFIIILIMITVITTIGIQSYWNYENYKTNEQLILNHIHNSFNEAVDSHFEQTTENKYLSFYDMESDSSVGLDRVSTFLDKSKFGSFLKKIDTTNNEFFELKSQDLKLDDPSIKLVMGKQPKEVREDLEKYTSRISIEIPQDSVDFELIDKVLSIKLFHSKISTPYEIQHHKGDSLFAQSGNLDSLANILETFSTSELIPSNQGLVLRFQNPSTAIFKRGLIGIILSLVLAACIIFSLFYLIHIINNQKQLAEIKNDLISNITHEFRTPIATVLAAIEGATTFNKNNDPEKNMKYLQVSKDQLLKLDTMVEKLLETAALDSKDLELKKSSYDIVPLVTKFITNYKEIHLNKKFEYSFELTSAFVELDLFHFENVINNLLDNAVKYGGNTINVVVKSENNTSVILISDNGNGIPVKHKTKVFDKFYRIPLGNRHDIKGFGIGLYYSKNVIEKHGGTLTLNANTQKETEFKITL